jgi:hypothetical protein
MSRSFATEWNLWGFDGTVTAPPTDQKVGGSSPSKRAKSPVQRAMGEWLQMQHSQQFCLWPFQCDP